MAIDAEGLLSVVAPAEDGGQLRAARLAAARQALPQKLQAFSKLRKVSLIRLEKAIQTRLAAGQPIDATMRMLAGLQRIHYVFCYPEARDVVLAGPAEGWFADASGRTVGITTGQPVLELVDLTTALRAFGPRLKGRPFIGCTIDPAPEGLAKFVEFQKTIPRSVPQDGGRAALADTIAAGIRDSLGLAKVRVFGVPANTHFAQVLIEADYRMKLIGVGLETPPVPMTTFADSLHGTHQGLLERWWFTPNYDCVRITDDGLGMALVGSFVQLQGEDKTIGPDGQLMGSHRPANKASELFTASFTRKYPDIAVRSPVYAQLRDMVDLVVAAAFIRRQNFYGRAGLGSGDPLERDRGADANGRDAQAGGLRRECVLERQSTVYAGRGRSVDRSRPGFGARPSAEGRSGQNRRPPQRTAG